MLHGHDDLPVAFDPPARGGADRIRQIRPRGDGGGLLDVAIRHGAPASFEEATQLLFEVRLHHELYAEDFGDGLASQIVFGRAEPARADDDVRAFEPTPNGRREPRQVVPDLRHVLQGEPQTRQLLRQVIRIRIHDLPEQQLRADRKDLRAHRSRQSTVRSPEGFVLRGRGRNG